MTHLNMRNWSNFLDMIKDLTAYARKPGISLREYHNRGFVGFICEETYTVWAIDICLIGDQHENVIHSMMKLRDGRTAVLRAVQLKTYDQEFETEIRGLFSLIENS